MSRQIQQIDENWRSLFAQHWLHCRHIESERAWFMSVYAAIVGGIVAYVFGKEASDWKPLVFVLVLTVVGLLINIRWSQAYEHHRKEIKNTAKQLGICANVVVPWKFRFLRTGYLFPTFYGLIVVMILVLIPFV